MRGALVAELQRCREASTILRAVSRAHHPEDWAAGSRPLTPDFALCLSEYLKGTSFLAASGISPVATQRGKLERGSQYRTEGACRHRNGPALVLLPNGTKAAVIAVAEDRSPVKVMRTRSCKSLRSCQYVIDVAGEIGDLPRTACGNTGPPACMQRLGICQGSALVMHALWHVGSIGRRCLLYQAEPDLRDPRTPIS